MAEAPDPVTDAEGATRRSTDVKHLAYAEAAIMLLECLMLKLIERQVLTLTEIQSTVEDAIATKRQMAEDGEHPEISTVASGLMLTLANSLAATRPKTGPR